MFAALAPILKMPRGTGLFDYAIPEGLTVVRGSIVNVPWRGKKIPGVVMAVREHSEIPAARAKPLDSVLPIPALTEDVVATIEWMSGDTFASVQTVVQAFLPSFLKKTAEALASQSAFSAPTTRSILRYQTNAHKWQESFACIHRSIAAGGSAIIVVPHINDVGAAVPILQKEFGKDTVIALFGDTASASYRKAWIAGATRSGSVIVGTRVAVMAPSPSLGAIIVHESDSPDLAQYDQNPRYDVRRTALQRSRLAGANLLLMSRFPRLEDYAMAVSGELMFAAEGATNPPRLVDVSSSAPTDFDKILSPAAMEAAETALQSQKKVVLFHNRQGVASALICRACRQVFRCATCETAFVVLASGLKCRRCGRSETVPATCSRCHSPELRTVGQGTTSLERELAQRFPESRVVRVDAEQPATDVEAVVESADILVGTAQLIHGLAELRAKNLELGAIIATSVEDLIGQPGYRTQERAARTLAILGDVAAESGAEFMAQCLTPDHERIRHLLRNYRAFADAELAERRRGAYPPEGSIITLVIVGENEKAVQDEAVKVRADLDAKLAQSGVDIRGPIRPGTPFRHGRWRSAIILKMKTVPDIVITTISHLPDHILIERDPEYLP